MTLSFEVENYQWVCDCGKRGRFLKWHKAVRASIRHYQEHERKLEWGTTNHLKKQEVS